MAVRDMSESHIEADFCLTGHYERKLKHLNKQKEGKKRLKRLAGNIDVPQAAFFEVLSSRRAFSTSSAYHSQVLDPVASYLPDDLTIPLVRSPDLYSPAHDPFEPDVLSPRERSTCLSSFHQLITSPNPGITSEDLHAAFDQLPRDAHIFTPAELTKLVRTIHTLDRRKGTQRRQVDARLSKIVTELRRLRTTFSARPVEPAALISRARHRRRVTSRTVVAAERTFRGLFPDPTLLRTDDDKRRYRMSVNHILYLCGLAGEKRRFEPWWNKMGDAGIEHDSFAFLARQILLQKNGQIDDLPQLLGSALERIDKTQGRIVLINHVLFVHAMAGRWDVVTSAYSKLRAYQGTEALPFPLDAFPRDLLAIPDDVIPSRSTYSSLVHVLSHNGHLSAALTIMRHMFEANYTPFVPEYITLFKGFARHGHTPPSSPGPAKRLFPFWETYNSAEPKPDRISWIWSRGALGVGVAQPETDSPWTKEVLDEIFRSYIALTPGGATGVPNSRNSRRAPSPRQVWTVMCAFARTTNGDEQVMSEAWEAMERKFGSEGWVGWRTEGRLERLRSGLERISGNQLSAMDVD